MRLLEIDVLAALNGRQQQLDIANLSLVDVDAFYGIEISEWPARIAEVAMWLMDHQMNVRLSEAFGQYFVRLPLQKSPKIVFGNALRLDWKEILPPEQCSYVLGNPPFVGGKYQTDEQRADMDHVAGEREEQRTAGLRHRLVLQGGGVHPGHENRCRLRVHQLDHSRRAGRRALESRFSSALESKSTLPIAHLPGKAKPREKPTSTS